MDMDAGSSHLLQCSYPRLLLWPDHCIAGWVCHHPSIDVTGHVSSEWLSLYRLSILYAVPYSGVLVIPLKFFRTAVNDFDNSGGFGLSKDEKDSQVVFVKPGSDSRVY